MNDPSEVLMKRILVPIDGSTLSGEAIREAFELARALPAEVILLHVVPDPGLPNTVDGVWMDTDAIHKDLRQRGRGLLKEAVQELASVTTRPLMRDALGEHPADVIVRLSNEEQVDLIIMGTHGRAGLERLLMGSVAERVAHHALAPVMLVRDVRKTKTKKLEARGT
jgi:nucleotide-binding universal stress UspA family protein